MNVALPYGFKKKPDHHGDKQRQQLRTLFKDNEIVVVCAFVGSCLADSSFDLVIITTFLEQGTGISTGCTTYFFITKGKQDQNTIVLVLD